MQISRLEASAAGDTSPGDWPVLADAGVPPRPGAHADPVPPGGWMCWRTYRQPPEIDVSSELEVALQGPPDWQYLVEVGGDELGTLLGCMPVEAVPEVIGAFLRAAAPELLGAVAGRLIAHVAEAAGRRREADG